MALSSLNIKLIADLSQFSSSMQNAERQMKKFSKNIEKTGKSMSMYLTAPIAAFGAVATQGFLEAEGKMIKLQAAIRANGKDVESTSKNYEKFAAEMQNLTTMEDDAVIGFLQLAESMQAPDAKQAVKDAIGLSKAYGIDMDAALKAVIKGQNGQYTALGKLVPEIKNAKTESEKAALAQEIYAKSFEVAKAETLSGTGALMQLKNSLGNAAEKIGGVIANSLKPLAKWLKEIADWFQGLSETQAQWITGILAVVAAIGPMLIIGAKLVEFFLMAKKALSVLNLELLKNPFVIVAAAIAALVAGIVYLSSKVGGLSNLWKLTSKYAVAAFKTAWEYIKAFAVFLYNFSKLAVKLLSAPFRIMGEVAVNVFKALPAAMKEAFTGNFADAGKILMEAIKDPLSKEIASIKEDFAKLGDPFVEATKNVVGYWSEVEKTRSEMVKLAKEAENVSTSFGDGTVVKTNGGGGGGGKSTAKRADIISIEKMPIINAQIEQIAATAAPVKIDLIWNRKALEKAREDLIAFNKEVSDLLKNTLTNGFAAIGQMIGSMASGETGIKGFLNGIISLLLDFGQQFGELIIAAGIAKLGLETALATPGMAWAAIGAGVALIAATSAIKGLMAKGAPAYANGTSSAMGGISLVGEYGPELVNLPRGAGVIPNRSLNYLGGGQQQVQVVGKISGNDIRLSNLRSTNRYNRI